MTELNHRRGRRGSRNRHRGHGTWCTLPVGEAKFWQSRAHRKRRQLIRKLIVVCPDDIPGNTPKHVRWDYW